MSQCQIVQYVHYKSIMFYSIGPWCLQVGGYEPSISGLVVECSTTESGKGGLMLTNCISSSLKVRIKARVFVYLLKGLLMFCSTEKVLPANNRLGWKSLSGTNALAYLSKFFNQKNLFNLSKRPLLFKITRYDWHQMF